jgi:hypothetical protein
MVPGMAGPVSLGVSWRLGVFTFSSANPRHRGMTIIARDGETEQHQQITR